MTAPDAGKLGTFLMLVAVPIALAALESIALPELFASAANDTLRPHLATFGGVSMALLAATAAVASGRVTRFGIAGALLLASLPPSLLAIAFLTTDSLIEGSAWSVLAIASAGLGAAHLAGHTPPWRPVPFAVGLVLAVNGALMLVSSESFSRAVYGDMLDSLLPYGLLLLAAGAGLVAGETLGRRGLTWAGAALAQTGMVAMALPFVEMGLWVDVVLYWMLALFLVVALLGEFTPRRMGLAQLGVLAWLGTWMIGSYLFRHPIINAEIALTYAGILALVGGWLLAEIHPKALWPTRTLAAIVVVLAAPGVLGLSGASVGTGSIASSLSLPSDTGVILLILAMALLSRTWWPDAGVVQVFQSTAISLAGALALVHLLVTAITAGGPGSGPFVHVEQDQAVLLFGTAAALSLANWQGASGPIQRRLYAAIGSALAIAAIASAIAQRALEALARLRDSALSSDLLALTDRVLVLMLILLVFTLVGSAIVISGQIVRPIEHMIAVARRRTAGDRAARVHLTGSDELGLLAVALDTAFAAQASADDHARTESERLRSVTTSALDAFVSLDAAGLISDWNPRAEVIFGWSAAEALGRPFAELAVPTMLGKISRWGVAPFFKTGERSLPERPVRLQALHRDGHTFTAELAFSTRVDGGQGVSAFIRDITEAERSENELQRRALHDPLTELPNRALVADHWQLAVTAAQRGGTRVGLALLDLDQFREVNDTLGHTAGDELLIEVGHRLRSAIRGADTVGRLGGDEFVVVLTELRSQADAVVAARSLLASLVRPIELGGRSLAVAASVGVVIGEHRGESFGDVLRKADVAMYDAKRSGGDAIAEYSQSFESGTTERLTLSTDLRAAIGGGGLSLAYQPVIDAASGEVLEVEALARWDHAGRGPIAPLEFVAVAERSGLINALGSWVLARALDDLVRWRAGGLRLGVHVNVSVRQFGESGFVDMVLAQIASRGLPPRALTIEITESLLIRNLPRIREDLIRLRAGGVRISLDDFGTGYSSISYLEHLPLDEIKLDKSMVSGLVDDARKVAIVQGVYQIARGLDLTIVAEGVEDEPTLDLIASLGDARAQGYAVSRPMPAGELDSWVAIHGSQVFAQRLTRRAAAVAQSLEAAERMDELSGSLQSLEDVLTNLWDALRGLVPYDRIGVALLEDDGRTLRARWAKASYSEAPQIAHGYSSPMAGSSLREVLRTGRPRIIGDLIVYLAKKPGSTSTRLLVDEGVRSSLTCPLVVDGAAVGFLFFSSRSPHAYHELHATAFESIAASVAAIVARDAAHSPSAPLSAHLVRRAS